MRKKIVAFSLFFLFIQIAIVPAKADGYITVSSPDFTIIEEENMNEVRSIASISKIMTAIIALEYGDYNDVWLVKDEIANCTGSMLWLEVGQKVSMRSLLYGLLLKSGNDAAVAIAYRVGGNSVEHFIELMNEKAKEIGMVHTEFTNPNGMDVNEVGNLSTPYDMALLMNYCLKNPQFIEIISTQYFKVDWGKTYKNSNKLLYSYPYIIGGKTGFTNKAGETLVTAARKDQTTFITVTLNIPDRFTFHQTQFEKAFSQYNAYEILQKGIYTIEGYSVNIQEAFIVTGTRSMMANGQFTVKVDEKKKQLLVYWESSNQHVHKVYPLTEVKKKTSLFH